MPEPSNAFLRDCAYAAPEGGWNLTYRQTPPGELMVPDLLHAGDRIEVKRWPGGQIHIDLFTVASVSGPYHYPDPGPAYPCFSVSLLDERGKAVGHINECVAVGGVVRGLFEANDLEIRGLESERESERAPSAESQTFEKDMGKAVQLSLF
ncbi:hypothetical protein [Azospirillum aestuarii]|uniref:hypothetical protein n=1 Tax=Azospirillum aestuarii TaxID=2802052 RepID=UPI004054E525